MPFTIPTGSINEILTTYLPKILAIQYLTVAGITIAAWDYILTFPLELRVIWKNNDSSRRALMPASRVGRMQWYALEAAYIFNRVAVVVLLAFYLDMATTRRRLSTEWCVNVSKSISVGITFIEAFGHCLALFRVFLLWNRTQRIRYFLVVGAVTMYVIVMVFVVLFVRQIGEGAFYVGPPIRQCYVNINTKLLLGSIVPQITLDIYAVLLVFWNAMDRPRSASERILEILNHDGMFLLLVTFGLRTVNACLIASSGEFQAVIALSFIQAVTTTINARLFLMLYDSQHSHTTAGEPCAAEAGMEGMDREQISTPLSPYLKMKHGRVDSLPMARSDTGSIASGEIMVNMRPDSSGSDRICLGLGMQVERERGSGSDVRLQTANGWYSMANLRPGSSGPVRR